MTSAAFNLVVRTLAIARSDAVLQQPLSALRAGLDAKLRRLTRARRRTLSALSGCEERLFWAEPRAAIDSSRVILFVHGGAFCAGSVELYSGLAGALGDLARARVAMAVYRLAPEHPFPAALEDIERAYTLLLATGVAPERLVVVGDSAGGGLALSALIRAKARGARLPAGLALLSPWVDLSLSGQSVTTNAQRDPVVRAAGLQRLARTYLAERAPCDDPSASPLFADLSGLPPCLVQVGRNELLRSDSTELVEALLRQGVNASLDLREDMFHGFYVMDELPEAQQALAHVSRFVNERFGAFYVTSQA